MGLSGIAIGIFKPVHWRSSVIFRLRPLKHTTIMNTAEGFFSIGAIIGPAILVRLLGLVCRGSGSTSSREALRPADGIALLVRYPNTAKPSGWPRPGAEPQAR